MTTFDQMELEEAIHDLTEARMKFLLLHTDKLQEELLVGYIVTHIVEAIADAEKLKC